MLAFLQRNVFADIIKRKEVMALPNLAEDLAYVSPLCVVGEGICVAGSLLRVFIDFVRRGLCVWVLPGSCRLALRGGSPLLMCSCRQKGHHVLYKVAFSLLEWLVLHAAGRCAACSARQGRLQSAPHMRLQLTCPWLQITPGPKALMHPDVEASLPGNTYNALTRKAGE